jgi:hypothetical protein
MEPKLLVTLQQLIGRSGELSIAQKMFLGLNVERSREESLLIGLPTLSCLDMNFLAITRPLILIVIPMEGHQ